MFSTARSLQSLVIFIVLTYFFIADDTVIFWWNWKLVRLLLPSVGLPHHKHFVIELVHGTNRDAPGKMNQNIVIFLVASRCGTGFGTVEALLTRGLLNLFLDFISVKSKNCFIFFLNLLAIGSEEHAEVVDGTAKDIVQLPRHQRMSDMTKVTKSTFGMFIIKTDFYSGTFVNCDIFNITNILNQQCVSSPYHYHHDNKYHLYHYRHHYLISRL